jgi:drug/metabolite transporter (DMT)-like permease
MSLVWTPFPAVAVDRFLKTAGTVLLALVALGSLPNQVRVSNANLLPIGVAATALAIFAVAVIAPAIARTEDIDTNTVDRATIGLVILVWPALGALAIRERMATAGIVAVAVSVAAVAVWMPAALAALILAIIAFSFAFSSAEKTGLALGAVVAAFVLLAPALPLLANLALGDRLNSFGPLSHFSSWAGVVKSDGFKLVTGHGFDTAARAYEAGRLGASPPRGLFFELWYELGVVGAGLAAVLAFLAFSIAGRASPALAPFLLAALSCIAALGAAGQSISQLWWLTLICVAAVSFALVMRCEHRADRVRAHMLGATVSSG